MPLDIGQSVKQVVPVITGTVKDVVYDAVAKNFKYLVTYETDGEPHERWFVEGEVEARETGTEAA